MHVDTIAGHASDAVLLLLHGGGVGGWMWKPLIKQLGSERTYIVPDLPGHDHSANHNYRSHREAVKTLVDVIEGQARGSVSVVGFSLGAQLAVMLAAYRPDLVDRVAIISAQAKPTRWPTATLAALRLAAPLAKNERFARAQAKELFIPASLFSDYLRTSRSLSKETLIASVGENIRFTIPRMGVVSWSRTYTRWRRRASDDENLGPFLGAGARKEYRRSGGRVRPRHTAPGTSPAVGSPTKMATMTSKTSETVDASAHTWLSGANHDPTPPHMTGPPNRVDSSTFSRPSRVPTGAIVISGASARNGKYTPIGYSYPSRLWTRLRTDHQEFPIRECHAQRRYIRLAGMQIHQTRHVIILD